MQGKHIAVTGPTSGIGHHTSIELARRGAQLTLFCRNPDKGSMTITVELPLDTGELFEKALGATTTWSLSMSMSRHFPAWEDDPRYRSNQ